MIKYKDMTYLIIGNDDKQVKAEIRKLIAKLWNKNKKNDHFEFTSPDIHTIETNNINSIGIEDVKRLQREMVYTPYSEKAQIALVFGAEKLTIEAQNSFLKTLEDSNSSTVYILTAPNEEKLLPTIVSRSLKIYTKEVPSKMGSEHLPETLAKNLIEAFKDIEKIAEERTDTDNFLNSIELYYQGLFKKNLKNREQLKRICDNIQCVAKTRKRINANCNRRLILENLFLTLRGAPS